MAFVNTPASVLLRKSTFHPTASSQQKTMRVQNVKPTRTSPRKMIPRASADPIPDNMEWLDLFPIADIVPGQLKRVIVANLNICIACAPDGQVYALGNKGPPLGIPLTDGSIVESDNQTYVKCGQYGTLFDVTTGDVKDAASWIPSPFIISNVLRALFSEPDGVPVYPIREDAGMLQVYINTNAREQYETKYWKGILDAAGKADGGYY